VKALIVLTQDFFDHNPGKAKPGHPIEADYDVTIDESNLVPRISMALNAYRRKKDRMADVMNKIVSGQYRPHIFNRLNVSETYVQSQS
jgi:hypothetical protein